MKKISKILILCLILVLAVSCGKSKNNQKIKIVLDWVPNTNHTGLYVAKDLGYFKEEGLDVEIVQPPEGSTTALIGAGGAEFGISFQDTLAKSFAKKNPVPVTAVAAILQQAILKKLVTDDKGDFSKVKLIPYTITDVVTGLKTNVDAVWVYYAWDGIATERAGLQTNFLKIRDYGEELDYYSPVIIANNDFLKKNPEIAKKVLKAIKKGYEYAMKNPEESAKILVKNSPELDINLVTASQKWISKEYQSDAKEWGIIDGNRWNRFYEWLYKNKAVEREIPKNFGYSNEYLK